MKEGLLAIMSRLRGDGIVLLMGRSQKEAAALEISPLLGRIVPNDFEEAFKGLVGMPGLEPGTSATRTPRASQLRYIPTMFFGWARSRGERT